MNQSNRQKNTAHANETPPRRRSHWLTLCFAVLLAVAVFAWVASQVSGGRKFSWDVPVLQFVHNYATPARDTAMVFITRAGSSRYLGIVMPVIALGLLVRHEFACAIFLAASFGTTALTNYLFKNAFQRMRPRLWESPAPEFDYGFPSGHSMISFALVLALLILTWNTRWRWFVFALGVAFVLLVGLSRVYLGVHYPSDVLGAWALAFALIMAVKLIWNWLNFSIGGPKGGRGDDNGLME